MLICTARDYIFAHINEPLITEALVTALGMNRTYLYNLFIREMRVTVNHYVTDVKMEEAKQLTQVVQKHFRNCGILWLFVSELFPEGDQKVRRRYNRGVFEK